MPTARDHLAGLDSLRGMAALAVCLFHSHALFGWQSFLPHAYIAVDFFFVLSGFILFYRYGSVMVSGSDHPVTARDYIVRRLARLYPLFLLATIVGFALTCARLAMSGELLSSAGPLAYALVSGVLMMPAFGMGLTLEDGVLFPFASPAWSVFWEIVLSVGFVFWARAGFRFVPHVAALALLALCILCWPLGTVDGGWRLETIHIGGLRALAGFSLGILAARLYGAMSTPLPPVRRRAISAVIFVLLGVVTAYVALGPDSTSLTVELLFLAIVFPCVVLLSARAAPRFLVNRLGILLGSVSYSLYLLHVIFRDVAAIALKRVDIIAPSPLVGLVWLAATLVCSYLCWRFFETPARRWLTAIGTRRPADGLAVV